MRCSLLAALFTLLFPLSVNAEEPGDPRAGRAFAQAHCAQCHGRHVSPNVDAPPFVNVAKTPGMTGRALAVFLQTSHPTMPNFVVGKKDRNNVIAYIMSLRRVPPW